MGRAWRLLFLVSALPLAAGPAPEEPDGPFPPGLFLDLPHDEGSFWEIIEFYGLEVEGNGIFFCTDRSSTMAQTTAGGRRKIDVCKQEFARAFEQMAEEMEFGIVFFDLNVMTFRETPVEATPRQKAAANQWVQSMQVGFGTCIGGGARTCLEIANKSSKPKRTMILLSDGDPSWCMTQGNTQTREQAREMIRRANTQRIPVNTVFIGTASQTAGREFMRLVAQENDGTFTEAQ